MCQHKFKSVTSSNVYVGGAKYSVFIDHYKCVNCGKMLFRSRNTGKRVYFDGGLGEEVESNIK